MADTPATPNATDETKVDNQAPAAADTQNTAEAETTPETPATPADTTTEAKTDETPAAEPEADKAAAKKTTTRTRRSKAVDLDEKLKDKGTFAVGFQAHMRQLIRNKRV